MHNIIMRKRCIVSNGFLYLNARNRGLNDKTLVRNYIIMHAPDLGPSC